MDPTNLILILCMGCDKPCEIRSKARSALEEQGIASMVTLLTFEKETDFEVARELACRNTYVKHVFVIR